MGNFCGTTTPMGELHSDDGTERASRATGYTPQTPQHKELTYDTSRIRVVQRRVKLIQTNEYMSNMLNGGRGKESAQICSFLTCFY